MVPAVCVFMYVCKIPLTTVWFFFFSLSESLPFGFHSMCRVRKSIIENLLLSNTHIHIRLGQTTWKMAWKWVMNQTRHSLFFIDCVCVCANCKIFVFFSSPFLTSPTSIRHTHVGSMGVNGVAILQKKRQTQDEIDELIIYSWVERQKGKNRFEWISMSWIEMYFICSACSVVLPSTLWQTNCDSQLTVVDADMRNATDKMWLTWKCQKWIPCKVINLTFWTLQSDPFADTYRMSSLKLKTLRQTKEYQNRDENRRFNFRLKWKICFGVPSTSLSGFRFDKIHRIFYFQIPSEWLYQGSALRNDRIMCVWQRETDIGLSCLIVPCGFDANVLRLYVRLLKMQWAPSH